MENKLHIATIEVQTNLFERDLTHSEMEKVATEILSEANRLKLKYSLEDKIYFEAYWGKGCVIEHLMVLALSYKFIKDYESLREGALLITKDLQKFSKSIDNIRFRVIRAVIWKRFSKKLPFRLDTKNNNNDLESNGSKDPNSDDNYSNNKSDK